MKYLYCSNLSCTEPMPVEMFYKQNTKVRGYSSQCKSCIELKFKLKRTCEVCGRSFNTTTKRKRNKCTSCSKKRFPITLTKEQRMKIAEAQRGKVRRDAEYYKKFVLVKSDKRINGNTLKTALLRCGYIKDLSCKECNWAEKHPETNRIMTQVHHKNGDRTDSVPENLEILCPNCHSLTESYCGMNKEF